MFKNNTANKDANRLKLLSYFFMLVLVSFVYISGGGGVAYAGPTGIELKAPANNSIAYDIVNFEWEYAGVITSQDVITPTLIIIDENTTTTAISFEPGTTKQTVKNIPVGKNYNWFIQANYHVISPEQEDVTLKSPMQKFFMNRTGGEEILGIYDGSDAATVESKDLTENEKDEFKAQLGVGTFMDGKTVSLTGLNTPSIYFKYMVFKNNLGAEIDLFVKNLSGEWVAQKKKIYIDAIISGATSVQVIDNDGVYDQDETLGLVKVSVAEAYRKTIDQTIELKTPENNKDLEVTDTLLTWDTTVLDEDYYKFTVFVTEHATNKTNVQDVGHLKQFHLGNLVDGRYSWYVEGLARTGQTTRSKQFSFNIDLSKITPTVGAAGGCNISQSNTPTFPWGFAFPFIFVFSLYIKNIASKFLNLFK